jgi:hypothetical protein
MALSPRAEESPLTADNDESEDHPFVSEFPVATPQTLDRSGDLLFRD